MFAQISFKLAQKLLACGAIFGGLSGVRVNSIEVIPSHEQVAGETAAIFERIARGLGELERFALAFAHLRRVDHGRSYRLFRLCAGFLSPATAGFFGRFEWRFHRGNADILPALAGMLPASIHSRRSERVSPECRNKRAKCPPSLFELLLIKFRPIARMLLQKFAGPKFHFGSGQPFQFLDGSLYSEVFRESQRPAPKWRKTGPQNHSVVRILWRIDDSFVHAASGLIHREQNEPMSQLLFIEP